MSQNNSGNYMDYMDGVPVKLSDKCKPPPEITLPYGVVEGTARANELLQSIHYDFSLETNVLKKLVEWQNARETVRNARNHRLQLKEEARQRELDLKAANETEEKLKQLSISEISYPSTEEISEISPDDGEESKPTSDSAANSSLQAGAATDVPQDPNIFTSTSVPKPDIVCDILQPVPVSPSPSPCTGPLNLLDDAPLILPQLPRTHHSLHHIKNNYMKNNLDHLTYLDFENDTSSPFDNLELETINDKELLAQVLNINQTNSALSNHYECNTSAADQSQQRNMFGGTQQFPDTHSMHTPGSGHAGQPLYSTCLDNTTTISNSLQPYAYNSGGVLQNNGYYEAANITNMNITPTTYYAPDYINYSSSAAPPYHQSTSNATTAVVNDKPYMYTTDKMGETNNYGNVISSSQYQRGVGNQPTNQTFNHYGYYNSNFPYYPSCNIVNNVSYLPLNKSSDEEETAVGLKSDNSDSKTMFGSRSRSVPDIVKELDEEVANARMRAKERSHNCSPSIRPNSESHSGNDKLVERLINPFQDLSPELQGICKRISTMGFPLDRVARACEELGAEDKKIIEYLLVMGQLMDLGFPESSVCKALLKHNCNRDKALDELIS